MIRRPIHRGSVLAAGLYADVRWTGELRARVRLLAEMGSGARLFREGDLLIAVLAAPARRIAETSPLGLLVKVFDVLSSAPLAEDEQAALTLPGGLAVVIVRGGEPVVIGLEPPSRGAAGATEGPPRDDGSAQRGRAPEGAVEVDPSSWIDVSDFEVVDGIQSLGRVVEQPRAAVAAMHTDVRAALGVPEEPPEARAVREALARWGARKSDSPEGALGGGRGGARGRMVGIARIAAGLLSAVGALLARLSGPHRPGSTSRDGLSTGQQKRALAAREDTRPPAGSWLSALGRAARSLALRMMVWSGLAGRVGRRQAEYLSRMLEMFEQGDLDAALKHAIPLGGEGGGAPSPPALGGLSPRSDLAIVPERGKARSSLYSEPLLFEELRRRYRRAFEALERAGDVEKAAFVLAELLGANEEAVAFLEKHRRYRLAAEIAEARGLSDGLVVRLWFLAGDARRAVTIARARGAFPDAVHRLTAAGQREEAAALRIAWADSLARAGQYAAAVTAIWPIMPARRLAGRWLDLAIEAGGPQAAQMAVRKARLFPSMFGEARDSVLAFLREPGEDGLANARALGAEIGSHPEEDDACRTLARPVLRALMRSAEPSDAALADRLASKSCEATLALDHRLLGERKSEPAQIDVHVVAAGSTRGRQSGHHNEDRFVVATLRSDVTGERRSPDDTLRVVAPAGDRGGIAAPVARDGIVLGVFDGMGGYAAGDVAAELARDTVLDHLRAAFGRGQRSDGWTPGSVGERAGSLREAMSAANGAIYRKALSEPKVRGAGAAVAVATVHGCTLIVAHVGDCRAYLLRGGALTPLTRDHTFINEQWLRIPTLTAEELANVPASAIMRALGVRETIDVELGALSLCDEDTLVLCTDGVHGWLPDPRLREILSAGGDPARLCAAVMDAIELGESTDDRTAVIARFSGRGLPTGAPVRVTPVEPAAAGEGDPVPLRSREEPLVIRRGAADTGAIGIRDAALLPNGRMVVAVGELGTWLLSREGRVETRFADPAHVLVISDQGDRALAVAERGESMRVARLDLAHKKKQTWCDARLAAYARTFDGSVWYVASGDTLYAIDATQEGWEHLFQITEAGARILGVARDETRLHVMFRPGEGRAHVWKYELPAHKLRSREEHDVDNVAKLWVREMSPWATFYGTGERNEEGAVVTVLDAAESRPRARVELLGARHASCRVFGDRMLVWDDRGRLLVMSLLSGAVMREVRLA